MNYTWLQGRQSFKAGYEYQHVAVEVQDVNPLYGLDTYGSQFTRPAGVTSNNIYNLADFMLGLRSQYALTTFFIAQMRQDLHFAYLQDDFRASDRLTLNLGLRYEYATPFWEANNVLTNFDPDTRTMIAARDGSIYDRALVDPDRNNFGPRLGLAYTIGRPHGRAWRLGTELRAHEPDRLGESAADQRSASRPRRHVQGNATAANFRPTEAGYPAGMTDPGRLQSARGQHQLHPARLPFEPGPELVCVGPARIRTAHADRRGVRRQPRRRPAAAGQLQPGRRRTTPQARFPWRTGGRFRPSATSRTCSTAANRATRRCRRNSNGGRVRTSRFYNALTFSKAEDNAAGSLENQNGNFPSPQDLNNLDADFGLSGYHQPYNLLDELHLVAAVRQRQAMGQQLVTGARCRRRRMAGIGREHVHAGRNGDVRRTVRRPTFQVSSITNDFWGANNYRPNVTCDPYNAGSEHGSLVQSGVRRAADRSEPAIRQRAAQQRPRSELRAVRSRRHQTGPDCRSDEGGIPARGLQSVQPRRTSCRRHRTGRTRRSARSRAHTRSGRFSLGSS